MGVCTFCWIIAEGKWFGRGLISGFISEGLFSAGTQNYYCCNDHLLQNIILFIQEFWHSVLIVVSLMQMIVLFVSPVFQETRIRASEKDPQSKVQNICISNQYGGEEVTHTLTTDSREDTHRWMEAFWQHFYDMSKYLLSCRNDTYAHTSNASHTSVAFFFFMVCQSNSLSPKYRPVEAVLWWLNENWTAITKEAGSCHTKTGLPLPWNG